MPSILAARKLATVPGNSPAYVSTIADAIADARRIVDMLAAKECVSVLATVGAVGFDDFWRGVRHSGSGNYTTKQSGLAPFSARGPRLVFYVDTIPSCVNV
ncbi:MAG TPA: hypothetical protein VJN93_13585 [Candidatus Acidoferrum sp.]|nr:hypothetical protein [Candidatus Acidoferrum sp.]